MASSPQQFRNEHKRRVNRAQDASCYDGVLAIHQQQRCVNTAREMQSSKDKENQRERKPFKGKTKSRPRTAGRYGTVREMKRHGAVWRFAKLCSAP